MSLLWLITPSTMGSSMRADWMGLPTGGGPKQGERSIGAGGHA